LACCEGAVLLVDAFQGVEAQTVANAYAALNQDLAIVPVINKVDLVHARVDEVLLEMEQSLAIDPAEVIRASAKTGIGIDDLLAAIVERIPPPNGDPGAVLRAMIFDSHYDSYRGAITYVRLVDGTIRKGQKIRFLRTGATHEVLELGQFVPQRRACAARVAGQVGYLVCNIKDVKQVHIGDTVTIPGDHAAPALPGYKPPQRMVYCGLYPSEGENFEELRDSLEKLAINDPSFEYAPESSEALGFGFRCGFLGLLHMEIIQQRLEQEADLDLVQTAPNVTYQILKTTGETVEITNPQDVPESGQIEEFRQPIVRTNFLTPVEHIGPIMQLCTDRRGTYLKTEYLSPTRAMLTFDLPLAEVIYDMHDRLKSITRGYGTLDYEVIGFRPADLVKVDILVKGVRVDALATIMHRGNAERRGRGLCKRLKEEISKHQFEIPIQAAIGTRIIARETIPALRKNVTAKCYGGDITRKRKLWAKQREGKKRLKQFGEVEIPQKAFLSVLDVSDDM
ncbi:MAG: translation elongation factor 4, partial [Planctomycetaceae bacterium]